MPNSKTMPRLTKFLLWCIAGVVVLTLGCNWWIIRASDSAVYRHPAIIPDRDVGLVLGTAPRVATRKNLFFEGRMDTAARLWKEGKVRHFLVSGDHGQKNYDETTAMRDALVARGVPAKSITQDHAGFRTLDSLVRAREVFGVEKLVVVTDDWHLPRALFLAKSAGVDAIGAAFEDVPWKQSAKTRVREWFSRVKAVADVYVLRTKPKFLGERVDLNVRRPS
jgi:SanA protein